jgi:hypothetical protein
MAVPGASTRIIGDLYTDILDALQQRTDITPVFAAKYVRKAIIELTESTPFEELRRTGPTVATTINKATYPVSFFLNVADDYNFMETLVVYIDPAQNTVKYPLDYMTPKAIETITAPATVGLPAYWTRFGTNLFLAPTPNAAYTMFARYQVKHPFPEDFAALAFQPLMLPDSWEEIVIYASAYRIAIVKRLNEQASMLHELLFGDPEFQISEGKRGRPGLIAARLLQYERDQKFNTRRLGILSQRYNR